MPEFVGSRIYGATQIENHAAARFDRVRLTYAQARRLPAAVVLCSLDTTDQGSKGSYAKRRYRWFAAPDAILGCAQSTDNMRERAYAVLGSAAHLEPIAITNGDDLHVHLDVAFATLAGAA